MPSIRRLHKGSNSIVLAITVALGLTPILWYRPCDLITGGDIDYPFYPDERLMERTYVWNPTFLGGTDRSMDTTTLFWTLVQVIPASLRLNSVAGEILTFVFWFTMVGLSMLFLATKLFPRRRVFQMVSVVFYMFNFYQFYVWEIARIGELSGMVLLPLLLGSLIDALQQQIGLAKYAVRISLFSIIGMGVGVQPPILIILMLTLVCFLIFDLFFSWASRKKTYFRRKILSLLALIGFFTLTNMFWILPVANYTIQSGYTSTPYALKVFSVEGYLLDWTSKATSFLNLFLMLPRVVWFDSWGGQPYFPLLIQFRSNPAMIIIGLILPTTGFSAILFSRNRHTLFFALVAVVSLFLSKGLHEPFGGVYRWMVINIPGFWIYRAPWEKFGLLQALSYAILIGYTCDWIYGYLTKKAAVHNLRKSKKYVKKIIPIVLPTLVITLNLVYNSPLILGVMIPSSDGEVGYHQKFKVGFYQKFPEYIFDARNWINSKDEDFNILLLPDDRRNVYNWGYASAKDITLNLFHKGVILRQYGEGTAPPIPRDEIYQILIDALYNNLTTESAKILAVLNVRYVLQRNDFRYDFYGDNDSPDFIRSRLSLQRGIYLRKTFGKWDLYEVSDEYFVPRIYATPNLVSVNTSTSDIAKIVASSNFIPGRSLLLFLNQSKPLSLKSITNQNPIVRITYKSLYIDVHNGENNAFNWSSIKDGGYAARFYSQPKIVVRTDQQEPWDTLSFSDPEETPYIFPSSSLGHSTACNSTLVYIKTDDSALRIDAIYEGTEVIQDVAGVWWETHWMGMSTNPITYPIILPPHQRAIIQINHRLRNVTLSWLELSALSELVEFDNPISLTFKKIDPTRYLVHANSSKPYFLVFNQPYHDDWVAYVDGEELETHFMANGYANAWYINKTGTHDITVEFWPQKLFYLGSAISITSLTICILYVSKNKIGTVYKRYVKRGKGNNR